MYQWDNSTTYIATYITAYVLLQVEWTSLVAYQNRKGNFECDNSLKDTQDHKEEQLYHRVDVDAIVWDSSEVLAVGTPLAWDEEQFDPLNELDAIERGHAHIQQETVEDRKWEEL